ncbi:barstar family protein [Streptomyces sp. MB09-01]|uniref:barstar family protein n=1 Tax=Streptomyces sp. MB09-01 TaxID=3028666 RepID=UPI0029B459DF|nr:barstar family protein [Streptomyces sp. MB09-01]MDX3533092.1 barstar family protein [Streptomyces sp. MB09-01]
MHTVPWVHVVPEQGALPVGLLLTGRTYVARVDGRQMRDTDAVFQQFYDGLRLPDYFGWNWNALFDCLRDLHWLPADQYVLIVEAADEALSGDAAGRRQLFGTLLRAGRRWSSVKRPEGIDLSRLVVVMSCDPASVPELQEQVRSCWEETVSSEGRLPVRAMSVGAPSVRA